uniref:ATP synthase F0 subunit 6 n=1 Tax=Barbatia decussata TaxID=1508519 RepID=UPI00202793B1|nr:ATP synthase F0 subunit 6 [Barbatia decussata]UQT66005.1 ATP synthase F0 subunit 6 [Barbatia decussata]
MFSGSVSPMIVGVVGNGIILVLWSSGVLWKTRAVSVIEYSFSIYGGLYSSKVLGFQFYLVCLSLGILILSLNGMIPGVVGWTKHVVLPVMFGLSSWLGIVILALFTDWRWFLGCLFPGGVPPLMGFFMSYVEMISSAMRPWTLSIRLMVNMIVGGLLLSLIGILSYGVSVGGSSLSGLYLVMTWGVLVFMGVYEVAVCLLQSYVFSLLLGIYMRETESDE